MIDFTSVRYVREKDLRRIREIETACFFWERGWSYYKLKQWFPSALSRWICAVDENDTVLGFLIGFTVIDEEEVMVDGRLKTLPSRPGLDVNTLAVHPDYQGQGIGRMLLHDALRIAADEGLPEASLWMRDGNFQARLLYESCGFAPIGTWRGWFQRPTEDAVLMSRPV